eukprot:g6525.t1
MNVYAGGLGFYRKSKRSGDEVLVSDLNDYYSQLVLNSCDEESCFYGTEEQAQIAAAATPIAADCHLDSGGGFFGLTKIGGGVCFYRVYQKIKATRGAQALWFFFTDNMEHILHPERNYVPLSLEKYWWFQHEEELLAEAGADLPLGAEDEDRDEDYAKLAQAAVGHNLQSPAMCREN